MKVIQKCTTKQMQYAYACFPSTSLQHQGSRDGNARKPSHSHAQQQQQQTRHAAAAEKMSSEDLAAYLATDLKVGAATS
jgi:hypothetical protein